MVNSVDAISNRVPSRVERHAYFERCLTDGRTGLEVVDSVFRTGSTSAVLKAIMGKSPR